MLNNLLKNKKVFIFDLDGTLIDSIKVWNQLDLIMLKELADIDVEEEILSEEKKKFLKEVKSSEPYKEYFSYLISKYKINMTLDEVLEYRKNITEYYVTNKILLKPYAKELVQYIKENNFTIILATTSNKRTVKMYSKNPNVSTLGLNEFDLILTLDDLTLPKPDPEIYLKTQELLEYKLEDAVVIEDSIIGCLAAKNASLDVIIVKEEYSLSDELVLKDKSDFYVESLEEIYKTLKKIPK